MCPKILKKNSITNTPPLIALPGGDIWKHTMAWATAKHWIFRAIKTDNGACFTNRYTGYKKSADATNPRLHDLDLFCQEHGIIHYLIDPGKPAQNGKVERSHRTDQELFYDRNVFKNVADLKKKLRIWNNYYNNL